MVNRPRSGQGYFVWKPYSSPPASLPWPKSATPPAIRSVLNLGSRSKVPTTRLGSPSKMKRDTVIVIHLLGSHGPAYSQRSPAAYKRFLPECTSVNLQDCSRETLLNAYDNSIAYTDHLLASTIGWLKGQSAAWDTAMVYVADHGESLGENNLYLHGLPYALAPDVQKHVPWITWLSPAYERRSGITTACLQSARDTRISHDHYFHSVVGLLGVQVGAYRPGLDVYARCAGA